MGWLDSHGPDGYDMLTPDQQHIVDELAEDEDEGSTPSASTDPGHEKPGQTKGEEMSQQQQQPPAQPQYWGPPPPPPKKKHTFLKVLAAVVVGGLVLIIGLVVLLAVVLNEAADDIAANDNRPGGADNPLTIEEGEAFEVAGFEYARGWSLKRDAFKDATVRGLKVTNNRDDKDSALVEIKVWDGKEVKALVDCTTEPIQPGTTVKLSCTSGDKLPKQYSKVTINDTF